MALQKKKTEVVRGFTIKYHANGRTMWSKGKVKDGKPHGHWEWFRLDGTRKRSGEFKMGEPVGKWTTYDSKGKVYKVTSRSTGILRAKSRGIFHFTSSSGGSA